MEAFMYRCHPQTARLVELLREGAIGSVRRIVASFGFQSGYDPRARLWSNELGGGAILDVGCYPVSIARLIAGTAQDQPFAEPIEVKGSGVLHPEAGVDTLAAAVLRFPGGILAEVATALDVHEDNRLVVYGTGGRMVVPNPWTPAHEGGRVTMQLWRSGREPEEIGIETDQWLFSIEADTVSACLDNREATPPAMSWRDSLGNMATLDRWRREIGLVYRSELPEAMRRPVHGRQLARRADAKMHYGRLPGLDKDVSRLVLGVDNHLDDGPHWMAMCDDFFERGGNCFDMAYIYGGGQAEKVIGQWLRNRGVRDRIVVIDKGAHTPYCDPENLGRQLEESLERLGTDYIDLYFMHRDNPEVPVGEFVDVLNAYQKKGYIRLFGGSNWTMERVEAANAYAGQHGLRGFAALSNNFSLARMIKPVWDGCLSFSDPASRLWLEERRIPLFPWSSQARGFFVRADPEDRSDPSLAECWYSEDNFRRLARARELAERRGVLPINIALAYVLCQPFATFPLIGPRSLMETRTSLQALGIELTRDEMAWLNLERDSP
jgi:aryl-alcohol dehydrogenase-like predicted oxidoreductase